MFSHILFNENTFEILFNKHGFMVWRLRMRRSLLKKTYIFLFTNFIWLALTFHSLIISIRPNFIILIIIFVFFLMILASKSKQIRSPAITHNLIILQIIKKWSILISPSFWQSLYKLIQTKLVFVVVVGQLVPNAIEFQYFNYVFLLFNF